MTQQLYLALLEHDGAAHGGLIPELNVSVVGKTREQVQERLERGAALALRERSLAGQPVPEPVFERYADLPGDLREAFPNAETTFITPAIINQTSVKIEEAIRASGLSNSEIARRLDTSPASIGRLQDYFYWGHSESMLRKLLDLLGLVQDREFVKPVELPEGSIVGYLWGGTVAPQVRVRNVLEVRDLPLPAVVRTQAGVFRLISKSEDVFQRDPEATTYYGRQIA